MTQEATRKKIVFCRIPSCFFIPQIHVVHVGPTTVHIEDIEVSQKDAKISSIINNIKVVHVLKIQYQLQYFRTKNVTIEFKNRHFLKNHGLLAHTKN